MLTRDTLKDLLTNTVQAVADTYSQQAMTSIGPDNKLRVWFDTEKNSISIELRFDDEENSLLIMTITSGWNLVQEEMVPFQMNDYDTSSFHEMLLRHLGSFDDTVIRPNVEPINTANTTEAAVDINLNPIAAKLRDSGFSEQDNYGNDTFEFIKTFDNGERIIFTLNYPSNTVVKRWVNSNEFLSKSSNELFTIKHPLGVESVLATIY